MLRACGLALVLLALVSGAAIAAEPPVCRLAPLEDQYADADAAFVGRLAGERDADSASRSIYRFVVDQTLKGPIGREVEVTAPPLTDSAGKPLARGVAVGVLAQLDGASFTTTSCGLIEAGSLISVSEPQRGNAIRIAIGLVIAALVVGYSLLRLRRRHTALE
jgi:hypothetical protein